MEYFPMVLSGSHNYWIHLRNWILGENIFSYPYFSWYYKGAKFPKIKKLGKADTVISLIRLKGKSEAWFNKQWFTWPVWIWLVCFYQINVMWYLTWPYTIKCLPMIKRLKKYVYLFLENLSMLTEKSAKRGRKFFTL